MTIPKNNISGAFPSIDVTVSTMVCPRKNIDSAITMQ
jgi:hypothetical protein